MSRNITRRALLGGLMSGVAGAALAGAPAASLRPQLRPSGPRKPSPQGAELLIRDANLKGHVTCAVIDIKTGKLLEGHDPKSGLPPASVTKAITALYALDALGPAFRFKTRLCATGPVENGILKGDLVLARDGSVPPGGQAVRGRRATPGSRTAASRRRP